MYGSLMMLMGRDRHKLDRQVHASLRHKLNSDRQPSRSRFTGSRWLDVTEVGLESQLPIKVPCEGTLVASFLLVACSGCPPKISSRSSKYLLMRMSLNNHNYYSSV